MATTFKTLLNNDVASTRTLLHEAVPITGTIVSGTYSDSNIKNFSHGMFQSVYDYPYLSSSANHIFDITMGYSSNAGLSSSAATQNSKKINIYNQMAQVLMGHDADGNIREFDRDGDLLGTTTDSMRECFFLNFARLLVKDEIKKGSFQLTVATASAYSHGFDNAGELTLYDTNAENEYRSNSPAGEYGLLYTASTFTTGDHTAQAVGQVFYQAGVVVLTSSLFGANPDDDDSEVEVSNYWGSKEGDDNDTFSTIKKAMFSGSISGSCDGLRNRIKNIQFNNTTELNSTIYFCRANHNEFNYSANPTYVTGSKMRVKNVTSDSPVSYITTVGLYSADNELLAVAKLSEPLKKTPENEITLRVRLDY
tara:strand:+ start:863 stop:1960 length:1098 start_codon:yes stop_codon:yes gene_type:complete